MSLHTLVPTMVYLNDVESAAAQGVIIQARVLGGMVGLSMGTIILNNRLGMDLTGILNPVQIEYLQRSLTSRVELGPDDQVLVAHVYAGAFNDQMRTCTYVSVAALLVAALTYPRKTASVPAIREKQKATMELSRQIAV